MRTKFFNFMSSFAEKFDTPKKFKIGQNFWLKSFVQKDISLSILDGFQQVRAESLSLIV